MHFGEYIRRCRRELGLTQEELVTELFRFDPETFGGLDASALSKWERGVTHTGYRRMEAFLGWLQERTGDPLPCLENQPPEEVQRSFCQAGFRHLLGQPPRHLIVDLKIDRLEAEHFSLMPLRHFERMEELLEIHQNLHENLNPPYSRIDLQQLREWALDPRCLFFVALYKNTVLGLLFVLRLRPESFDAIMEFGRERREITAEDFADESGEASLLILSLFSLDGKVATLLMMRLYAHLIAHRKQIRELGVNTALREVAATVERMDLRVYRSRKIGEHTHIAYRNSLADVLRSRAALQLLFSPEPCRE